VSEVIFSARSAGSTAQWAKITLLARGIRVGYRAGMAQRAKTALFARGIRVGYR